MKHSITLFLLLLISLSSIARGRYSDRLLENGHMYFFMPTKLSGIHTSDKLNFDMTILSYSDSITINMTLTSPGRNVKKITLKAGDITYTTTNIETFFREQNSKNCNSRLHIGCPREIFTVLYHCDSPMTFAIEHEKGTSSFTYSKGNWNKDKICVSNIFEDIKYYNNTKN